MGKKRGTSNKSEVKQKMVDYFDITLAAINRALKLKNCYKYYAIIKVYNYLMEGNELTHATFEEFARSKFGNEKGEPLEETEQ